MSSNFNKNRIAKNTALLYVRMLFTMWLNLYATRLVLANLGVSDMGVYGVVGSIVSMFAVVTGGITNSVQRFITYEMGCKDGDVNKVFCTSINVIFLFSAFLILLLEIGGVWVLNNYVKIPEESQNAAFWVFQLSVLTCIINMIAIPYNSLIIAHEKMDAYAVISVLQVVLTCGAAYCLSFFDDDRLLIYAIIMAVIGLVIRVIYQIYCRMKFPESIYHAVLDKSLIVDMSKFMGASSVSSILQMVSSQGITFVINWTFGVALNAVYNIALQLKNSVMSFSFNLLKAIQPQITKTYAEGNIETHCKLVLSGAKIEAYLIYFIMMPLLCKTNYIMHLWLGNVPEYTVAFTRCTIFLSLTYAIFEPIRTAVMATGNITRFTIIPEALYILVLPICYGLYLLDPNPVWMIMAIVGTDVAVCGVRVYYALKVSALTLSSLVKETFAPCALVALLSMAACYAVNLLCPDTILGLIALLCFNSIVLCAIILFCGINSSERNVLNMTMKKAMEIIHKR